MGFNIAGLVIDKNFDKEIDKLGEALEWGIEVIEEIDFEKASHNWTPDGEFNIYFSDKATMIFFPHELAINKYHIIGTNSLCYAYSATAMTFIVSYQDRDSNYRFFMESDRERQLEEGTPLEYEKEFPTADGLIFKLFDVLLKDNFHSIEFSDKAYRCRKVPYVPKEETAEKEVPFEEVADQFFGLFTEEETEQEYNLIPKEGQASNQTKGDHHLPQRINKKWWEFWK